MAKTTKILIAGFGGQGVLFTGKALAYTGLKVGMEVSWLPSYGPEMRGGTANCSVTLSDTPIGSPIVDKPDVLIAMNLPSLEKFYNETEKDGYVIFDSSLIVKNDVRDDVVTVGIPATKLASDNGLDGLANMIILGKVIKETNVLTLEQVKNSLAQMVPAKKAELLEKNVKAIELGYNY
ncbi:MAG: 2-oxoacid:acceptor oxidoreductase family protein [Clostridia bacterium]|nr:2-oxoacid:acceptor oxidoreductase family protein [Clostridia bacterium]MBR2448683.1 2-oxoacid:acceptor oxidoreductase family protein [Clostridia bacterium]